MFVRAYEYDTCCPTAYGGGVVTALAIEIDATSGTVSDAGGETTAPPLWGTAFASAMFTTSPAATSTAVTVCLPRQTVLEPVAGAVVRLVASQVIPAVGIRSSSMKSPVTGSPVFVTVYW